MSAAAAKQKQLDVADVVRHGEKLIIPESITLDGAIDVLQRKKAAEEEVVRVMETIKAFPYDAALAMRRVLERRLGAAITIKTPGMFGGRPPSEIAVEVAFGKTETVTWGRYLLPGITPGVEGADYIETGYNMTGDGVVVFMLQGEVRRKYLPLVKALAQEIRDEVAAHSIYKGKAFRVSFFDDSGDRRALPEIKFLDTTQVNLYQLVYSDDVQAAIETNIFTPIRHATLARKLGVPAKRGILLSGKYGTGKTLTAYATAQVCEESAWTFVYITKASELSEAIRFAQGYGPSVIFAEDIDRTTSGERTARLDDILNTIDGIDSKGSQVMVVLTTNHLETINAAMLRPGRLDAVIEVTAPDQGAVERLIRVYAREMLDDDTDVSHVAVKLAGQIPAVIREVVERSKLYWLNRTGGEGALKLAEEDISYAATTVLAQRKLTEQPETEHLSAVELFARGIGEAMAKRLGVPGWSPEQAGDLIQSAAEYHAGKLAGSGLAVGPALPRTRRPEPAVAD